MQRAEGGLAISASVDLRLCVAAGVVATVGLLLRAINLGSAPLQPGEVSRAYEAYTFIRGAFEGYADAPLSTNVQAFSMLLFGDGEAAARLPGVIAGSMLVLLPLSAVRIDAAWRLGASLLVALSSVALLASREQPAAALSSLLACLLAISAWNYWHTRRSEWLISAAVALGLGLASGGPFAISVALAAALGSTWAARRGMRPGHANLRLAREAGGQALLVASASFLLGATLLGTSPSGLQAALASFWRWPRDIGIGEPQRLLGWVLDDPLVFAAALVGVWLAIRTRRDASRVGVAPIAQKAADVQPLNAAALAACWAALQLGLVLVMRAPDPRYLAVALVPLCLLGGLTASAVASPLRSLPIGHGWWLASLGLIPVIFFIFSVLQAAKLGSTITVWVPVFAAAACGLVVLFALSSFSRKQCAEAALAWVLVLLALGQVRGVSVLAGGEPRAGESLLRQEVNLRSLADVRVTAIRWERAEPTRPIVVDRSLRPLLLWELRDVKSVTYQSPPARIRDAAILPSGADRSLVENRQVLQVDVQDTTAGPTRASSLGMLARWLIAREIPGRAESRAILLAR